MSSRPNSSRVSLSSLHDAARKGDSCSLQRLISIVDPKAADKVAAVLQERSSCKPVASSATETDPNLPGKKLKGPFIARGGPQTRVARRKQGTAKKVPENPLKRLLQKQDTKRRTALYVACAAGNTAVADILLAVGASSEGHGAWQRTPLHIAAYQGQTSAVRSLLGAGADPWAVNGRGQTPSDVSYMYNPNGQVLELLEQAVDMRTAISTGGLAGATFVHDDGQVGNVAAVIERWSFTLEVELDSWKMGNRLGAKVYIPVRGLRHHTSKRPSSDNLTASIGNSKASSAQTLPENCEQSIPWLAKTVGRMRLENDGLVKVNADNLVGATANTPVGRGAVISVRDVSVRCDVETVRRNDAKTVEKESAKTTSSTYDNTGGSTFFDAEEGERTLMANETRECHHVRSTEYGRFSPSVKERGPAGSPGSLSEDERNLRGDGHGDHNDNSAAQARGKRQAAYCERSMPARTIGFNEWITPAASNKVPPGERSVGSCCHVGEYARRQGSDDDVDESDASDGCSEGTERAAEFDEWTATAARERTRKDFGPEQVGAGRWTAHEGAVSHTRRHTFLDNLVPLAALEGAIDFQTLLPSATTRLSSRERKRRLLAQGNGRVPASPATPSPPPASYPICQQHSATSQSWPTSVMLEVDDLFHLILDKDLPPSSTWGNSGAGGNGAQIVGLEDQIEREECSEERSDEKRINMEATRSAVVEALVLWGSKADLLKARLVVVRTMATAASSASRSAASATASTSKSNTMSLEEYLASPSPRCCACDKRGGHWQETNTEPLMHPISETNPSITVPASPEAVGNDDDDAGTCTSIDDTGQSSTSNRGISACARKSQCCDDSAWSGDDARRASMGPREEQLIIHLQECHAQMTHLRDWLRLLDTELG